MENRTLRYGARSRWRDIIFSGFTAFVAPLPLTAFDVRIDVYFGAVGGTLVVCIALVARWRWTAWADVDAQGVAAGGGRGDPVARLAWKGLTEVGVLRKGGLILRGEDVVLHLPAELDGLKDLFLWILREPAPRMYRRLRDAYRRGETLEFHGPESPSWAAAKGILQAMLLAGPLCILLWWLHPLAGIGGGLFLLFGIAGLRAVACETIRMDAEGLVVRRLRTSRIPWELVRSASLQPDHRLFLELGPAGLLIISPEIGNFIVLQELVLERLAAGVTSP